MNDHYEPREDSLLLEKNIKRYARGRVLDMGTGLGIQAIEASGYANKVIATDISRRSLRIAKRNAREERTRNITFRKSDLFSRIAGKFDLIIFNPPYLPIDKDIPYDPTTDGGKKGYEVIEGFMAQTDDYLKPDGKILLLFSSLTKKREVDRIIKQHLFKSKVVDKKKISFETLYVYLIEKTDLLKKLSKVRKLRPYSKGKRGLVYTGRYRCKKVAVKVENPDSKAINRINNEANFLRLVNAHGIGPKLYDSGEDYIIMQYVKGKQIIDFLDGANKRKIRSVLKKTFEQMYTLDNLKINKAEMHRPIKHLIITRCNKPVLLDFERARKSIKTQNVTQFCQFITSTNVSKILKKKNIKLNRSKILKAAQRYSKEKSKENLKEIIILLKS